MTSDGAAAASSLRMRIRGSLQGPVGRLTAGSAAAQAVGLLVSPITARVFSPAESGAAAVFVTLLSVPIALASLRYEAAIAVPSQREDRSALLRLSLFIAPLVALITLALLVLLKHHLVSWLQEPRIAEFIWFAPFLIVLMGWSQALSAWATREALFRELAAIPIRRVAQQLVFQLGAGVWSSGAAWVLVAGHAIGGVGGSVSIWRRIKDRVLNDWRGASTPLVDVARRFRSFPVLNAPGTALNYVGAGIPLLAIGALHGTEAAGLFRWGQLLLWIPMTALVGAISSVYGVEAARLLHENVAALRSRRRQMTRRLALLACCISAAAVLLPFVVPVVFGARWGESGVLAVISLPAVASSLLTTPTGSLHLYGRNDLQLAWEALRATLTVAAYFTCRILETSLRESTAIIAVAMTVGYLVHWALNEWMTRRLVLPSVESRS